MDGLKHLLEVVIHVLFEGGQLLLDGFQGLEEYFCVTGYEYLQEWKDIPGHSQEWSYGFKYWERIEDFVCCIKSKLSDFDFFGEFL